MGVVGQRALPQRQAQCWHGAHGERTADPHQELWDGWLLRCGNQHGRPGRGPVRGRVSESSAAAKQGSVQGTRSLEGSNDPTPPRPPADARLCSWLMWGPPDRASGPAAALTKHMAVGGHVNSVQSSVPTKVHCRSEPRDDGHNGFDPSSCMFSPSC